MTKHKKSTTPVEGTPQGNGTPRPKRRTAKVDYTEKKDYDFEIPTNAIAQNPQQQEQIQQGNQSQTTQGKGAKDSGENGVRQKRKYTKRSATSGSNTRSDTPLGSNNAAADDDDSSSFPINYQPSVSNAKFSHMLDLTDAVVKDGIELVLANGERLVKNDNIYLICEPPGEPYYIGRIMGFVKKDSKHFNKDSDSSKIKTRNGKSLVESADGYRFKVNWYYRSRDISKHSNDSRLLYVSMHSDTCPLQSYRGRCVVKHKDEVEDFEAFKSKPNQFWFDKLFDRYMIRFYDVLPTSHLTNLPENYYKALMKRFPYIFVEQGKSKDMLQSPKSCAKCNQWCNHNDSIICCECQEMYHMLCLDPPLYKKPARGFAWSCIKCTKKLEGQKLIPNKQISSENDDGTQVNVEQQQQQQQQQHHPTEKKLPLYEELAKVFLQRDSELSLQDRRNQEEWVYRYLGMHAKLEDALDLQDRPYPRAASRLGSKHQLTGVQDWFGHIVQYYDNSELPEEYQKATAHKKKKVDGRKKKNTSEEPEEDLKPLAVPNEFKDMNPNEFPPWLQERPKGYIERGGEDTSTLMWKQPESPEDDFDDKLNQYFKEAEPIAVRLNLLPNTPNFMDQILKNLLDCNYDFSKAQNLNQSITRETLKEPTFTPEEISKFEDGVRQFGSELYPVFQHVKTQPSSMIVRFYYLWKKTKNGHLIWDNFEGRRKTKNKPKEVDESEDLGNSGDDSSYDYTKSGKKSFQCKHCKTLESIQWFRSPGQQQHLDDSHQDRILALCMRCARLWRRYAVIWEEPVEVLKKIGKIPGYGWKKKVESELILDSELILKAKNESLANNNSGNGSGSETPGRKRKQVSVEPTSAASEEPVKKSKTSTSTASTSTTKAPIISASNATTTMSDVKSATPEPKPTKEKRPYNKKSFEPKQQPEEKPEIVISNILSDTGNTNLQQSIVERYYHSTSKIYNSRVKFEEFPNQRSPLVSQESSKLIKPITNSKKCAVCLDNSDPNTSLFCYGCGINIHPTCYGVDSDEIKNPLGSYKWFCDPCSNTLNPLISNNYKCSLCGMHNDDEIIKAGLKRTNDGKWVHVLCALFNEHVKFANNESLQPITGLHSAIASKYKDGITKKSCHVCNNKITLSMAQQPSSNVHVGFKIIIENKPDSKCIKFGNNYGRLTPIALCGAHSIDSLDFEFLSLTSEGKRYKQSGVFSALELFLDEKKNVNNGYTGVQARFTDFQDACKILNKSEDNHNEDVNEDGVEFIKCVKCSNTKTLKWIERNGDKICYNCYLSEEEDHEMKDVDNNDDDTNESNGEQCWEKIVEVSNAALHGENYGISDPNDKLIKPDQHDEEYTFESQPPNSQQQLSGPQSLPYKNGTISEYRYYPPPPSDGDDAPSPHLAMFMNGGLKLQRAGSASTANPSSSVSTPLPVSSDTNISSVVNSQVLKQETADIKKHSINSIMNTDQSIPNSPAMANDTTNNNNTIKSENTTTTTTTNTSNTTTTTTTTTNTADNNNNNEKYVNKKMSIGSILG